MTREEINNLSTLQLNAYVRSRVMDMTNPSDVDFGPAERMDHAWLVVLKMREAGYVADMNVSSICYCSFWGDSFANAKAETMPLAICRASLAMIEKQVAKHSE